MDYYWLYVGCAYEHVHLYHATRIPSIPRANHPQPTEIDKNPLPSDKNTVQGKYTLSTASHASTATHVNKTATLAKARHRVNDDTLASSSQCLARTTVTMTTPTVPAIMIAATST